MFHAARIATASTGDAKYCIARVDLAHDCVAALKPVIIVAPL